MSANLTTLAGVLKRLQEGGAIAQQNLKHRAMDEIAKSAKKYNAGGAGFYGAINDYGNESVGAINETEQFRTIDNENYQQYVVTPKVLVAPVEFSGLAAKAADSDDEAFAEAVVREVEMAKERLLKDMNRQFFGRGTGQLAVPAQSHTAAVVSFTVDSAQYLRANMVVDIFNGATKTVDSRRISRVDKVNNVIHFATSLGVAIITTDVIVKENIRDSAATDGKEMMGLDGIVDDSTLLTTFQSINALTRDEWRAVRISAASGNLTSDLMQRLVDDIAVLSGEESELKLIMHPKQRRKYLDIVVPEKRYADQSLDAGFKKLSFNGTELWLDVDCQDDQLFAINPSHLFRFEVAPLAMGNHDGSDVYLRATDYDKFQAYWRGYMNFGTDRRNAHGKIVLLARPSGIS